MKGVCFDPDSAPLVINEWQWAGVNQAPQPCGLNSPRRFRRNSHRPLSPAIRSSSEKLAGYWWPPRLYQKETGYRIAPSRVKNDARGDFHPWWWRAIADAGKVSWLPRTRRFS